MTESPTTASKACPFCGEEILPVAVKCKHCQTMLPSDDTGADGQPKRRGSFYVWIVLCIGLTVGIWFYFMSSSCDSDRVKETAINLIKKEIRIAQLDLTRDVMVSMDHVATTRSKACLGNVVFDFSPPVRMGLQRMYQHADDPAQIAFIEDVPTIMLLKNKWSEPGRTITTGIEYEYSSDSVIMGGLGMLPLLPMKSLVESIAKHKEEWYQEQAP